MFETGTARHSMHNPDPILHLLVSDGGAWRTWCGYGLAAVEMTPSQRRCRKCLTLARNDLIEMEVEPDEASDFDWYLSRAPRSRDATAALS